MTPNPGSQEAIEQGCKCPVMDNRRGKGVYIDKNGEPVFWYSGICKIHKHKLPEDLSNLLDTDDRSG